MFKRKLAVQMYSLRNEIEKLGMRSVLKTVADIGKYIEKRDSKRRTYYRTYTGREMDDPANYNICLDVGAIGVDRCAEFLIALLKD